jgi:hypothetical protein
LTPSDSACEINVSATSKLFSAIAVRARRSKSFVRATASAAGDPVCAGSAKPTAPCDAIKMGSAEEIAADRQHAAAAKPQSTFLGVLNTILLSF